MEDGKLVAFPRATNETELPGLGDPERWGGTALLKFHFPGNANLLQVQESRQLVRVQVPDLMARQWLVLAQYHFDADDPLVTLTSIDLVFSWGVGQISVQDAVAEIFPFPVNAANAWTGASSATDGVVEVGTVTASSLACFARARVHDAGAINAQTPRVRVSVTVAPRAL